MAKFQGVEYYISKGMGKAIMDYKMITEGDKILVAVSGGKDSLTMLRVLNDRRAFVPIKYDLLAVHIDMDPRQKPKALVEYLKKSGVDYHIEKIDVFKGEKRKDINCFWCSWNRRKALFQAAERLGCTKVALGHHMDDIAETMLLNLFFQGEISAMNPKQELFKGKITIIRPLAYVEENQIRKFSKQLNFPHQKCACPNSVISNRTKVKKIIRDLEKINPDIKKNIFRSLKRIKKEYLL